MRKQKVLRDSVEIKLRTSRSVSFSIKAGGSEPGSFYRNASSPAVIRLALSFRHLVYFSLPQETAGTRLTTLSVQMRLRIPQRVHFVLCRRCRITYIMERDSVKHLFISQTTGKEGSGKTSPLKNWKKKSIRMIIRHFRRKLSKSKGLRNASKLIKTFECLW